MALTPEELDAIARAVLAYSGPATFAGFIAAVVCGILIALKITVPFGARVVEQKIEDPNGRIAASRKREREEILKAIDEKLAVFKPDMAGLQLQVDFGEQFKSQAFQDALQTAFKSAWGKRGLGAVANAEGVLTQEQQAELDALAKDPDGKVELIAAENAIDFAINQKLLKPATGKALKKQINSVFDSGGSIEAVLEPYRNLLGRLTGTVQAGGATAAKSGGPAQW